MFLTTFAVRTPPGLISGVIIGNIATSIDAQNMLWFYILDVFTLNIFFLSFVLDPMFILRNLDVKESVAKLAWIPPYWY